MPYTACLGERRYSEPSSLVEVRAHLSPGRSFWAGGRQSKFTTDENNLSLLPWALISLVLAVVFGLPVYYPLTSNASEVALKLQDSAQRLLYINYIKSWILTGALVCQTIGIIFPAIVVWNILSN
jgi:hypothetical protein